MGFTSQIVWSSYDIAGKVRPYISESEFRTTVDHWQNIQGQNKENNIAETEIRKYGLFLANRSNGMSLSDSPFLVFKQFPNLPQPWQHVVVAP